MQAQVKYESEIKTAVLGDRTITVKNVTPIYPPPKICKIPIIKHSKTKDKTFLLSRKYKR